MFVFFEPRTTVVVGPDKIDKHVSLISRSVRIDGSSVLSAQYEFVHHEEPI